MLRAMNEWTGEGLGRLPKWARAHLTGKRRGAANIRSGDEGMNNSLRF